jgi:hypothetical protein
MEESTFKIVATEINKNKNDVHTLFVAFAGHDIMYGKIPRHDFVTFLITILKTQIVNFI